MRLSFDGRNIKLRAIHLHWSPGNFMAGLARVAFARAIFRSRSVESQPRVQMQDHPSGRHVAHSLNAHASLSSTRSPAVSCGFGLSPSLRSVQPCARGRRGGAATSYPTGRLRRRVAADWPACALTGPSRPVGRTWPGCGRRRPPAPARYVCCVRDTR